MTIKHETMQDYAREYLKLKAQIDELEAQKTKLAEKFREELGDTAKEQFGKYTIATFVQTRPSISAKAVKELFPDIYKNMGKDIPVKQVRVSVAR